MTNADLPYEGLERAVPIHPTVSELIPTLLNEMQAVTVPGGHDHQVGGAALSGVTVKVVPAAHAMRGVLEAHAERTCGIQCSERAGTRT